MFSTINKPNVVISDFLRDHWLSVIYTSIGISAFIISVSIYHIIYWLKQKRIALKNNTNSFICEKKCNKWIKVLFWLFIPELYKKEITVKTCNIKIFISAFFIALCSIESLTIWYLLNYFVHL